ncbi:hypothetical protein BDZ89DRAFT_1172428 [Hymenopellis radicata]|nr:hypothetical protein BDZ89DRAFT_1172428 [Hymenopellis radicata]
MRLLLILAASFFVPCLAINVDTYVSKEYPIAKANLLANIGPSVTHPQVKPGVVVASPSPYVDYFYSWTRDSALVFKCLIDEFTSGRDTSLESLIKDYVASQARIQRLPTSAGLGEPKFYVNETVYTGTSNRHSVMDLLFALSYDAPIYG